MDWRMVGVAFQVFQFVFMAVIFLIIKLNDFKHVEEKINEVNETILRNERIQTRRHEENQNEMKKYAEKIDMLYGRCNAINGIKNKK